MISFTEMHNFTGFRGTDGPPGKPGLPGVQGPQGYKGESDLWCILNSEDHSQSVSGWIIKFLDRMVTPIINQCTIDTHNYNIHMHYKLIL